VLHLGTDADTGRIIASVPTDRDADDGSEAVEQLCRVLAGSGSMAW
jgi:hypothetical protein